MANELEGDSTGDEKPHASILVVDDVRENLELLTDVLADEGYTVLTSLSGAQALDVLQEKDVHLIVADAMMPKMDGLELCKRVRSGPPKKNIPFIIYTGNYIDAEDQELAHVIGVDKYVMKSEGISALIKTINRLLLHRYGFERTSEEQTRDIDEQLFLERHHSIVTKKLEDKMKELQVYAETLSRKNRELTLSESRYRELFEHAIEAIFIIDNTLRRIVDVNRKGETLLGCTREEILKWKTLPLQTEDGVVPDIYDLRRPFIGEAVLKTGNGEFLHVDISSGPINLRNDYVRTLFFVRNITEQKQMREQMLQAEKMSSMGRIAAGIAHEIRNPLAGISLNLQFLERHLSREGVDYESVKAALEGVTRIQQVIDDTLGLARVTPPSFRSHAVNPIIEKVVSYIKLGLRNKNLSLKLKLDKDLPNVRIDASQIQQVLLNALQNAIDASPESGTIEVATTIDHAEDPDKGRCVVITVHDSGQGLPKSVADHLFEPFRTTKTEGTGLGLMLSKYIIDRHKGTIEITNAPQGGALVKICVPI